MSVRKIGVIGTGRVGTGLAALSVSRGLPTVVVGHSREGLLKCRDALIDHLEELTRLGWLREPDRYGALERLEITDAWEELTGAELVFEAVREERAIKQAVLRKAEEYLDSRTPLLSCTSSLLPSELAALADSPARVLAVHPVQPVYLRPVAELAGHGAVPAGFLAEVAELLRQDLGLRTILLRKEVRGFLLDRIVQAILRECLWLLEQGVTTAADLESVVRCGLCLRCDSGGLLGAFDDVGMGLQARLAGLAEPVFPGSCFLPGTGDGPDSPPGGEPGAQPLMALPDCPARKARLFPELFQAPAPDGHAPGWNGRER